MWEFSFNRCSRSLLSLIMLHQVGILIVSFLWLEIIQWHVFARSFECFFYIHYLANSNAQLVDSEAKLWFGRIQYFRFQLCYRHSYAIIFPSFHRLLPRWCIVFSILSFRQVFLVLSLWLLHYFDLSHCCLSWMSIIHDPGWVTLPLYLL